MEKRYEKRVVQDIVASGRRTVRRVPAPRPIPRHLEVVEEEMEEAPQHVAPTYSPISPRKPRRRIPGILLTFGVVFVGIAIIAVALSLLYSKAVVTITPKSAHLDVSQTVTAKKALESSFGYEVVTTTDSLTQTVAAVDGPLIETKAKGSVTLYNEQPTAQKIVAGTRLANADGLVYRTTATVVIPQIQASKVPGSIAVAILADQAGAEYNMPLSEGGEFNVIAYKGGPKYTMVYGKLKTSITGGFSGNKKTISPEVQAAAITELKATLKDKLLASAKSQVGKDDILYDNAYTIEYIVSDPIAKDKQTADITVKGTLSGAKFNKNDLLKNVAAKDLDKFSAPTYTIEGMEDLKFTLINSKDFSAKKGNPLIFSLKGPVKVVGTFSETGLRNELKGTYLKESNTVFAHYPAISNAYALITPFWIRYFPTSPDKIIVEIKN